MLVRSLCVEVNTDPEPALAARVIGEVTPEKIGTIRQSTGIVVNCLSTSGAFQYLAILHEDKVAGVGEGKNHLR